jgi:hypothetical protein
LVLEHCGLWAMKTVPVIGVAISGPALLVCLIWYFWPGLQASPPREDSAEKKVENKDSEQAILSPQIGALRYVVSTMTLEGYGKHLLVR